LCPNMKAPLPVTLKLNGYSTAQFGKCHEVPSWHASPMGPFNQWPTGGGGFEYFYGFLGGETNQCDPALYEGTRRSIRRTTRTITCDNSFRKCPILDRTPFPCQHRITPKDANQ